MLDSRRFRRLFRQFLHYLRRYGVWRTLVATWLFFRGGPVRAYLGESSSGLDPHAWNIRYEEQGEPATAPVPVKLLAYYLPQFHPIPENDRWWGEGFTEWTNVARATPCYPGHNQPDIPGALGFYDLRLPEILRQQIRMARHHGISGFCFHYYWFSGKRLLELPLERFLADPGCDMPFCLNWANENWTRRWDGLDQEVLIAQRHSPEDDQALMRDVLRYFADPRYIRIDGRPLFLVYHAGLLPDMAGTLDRWREVCLEAGEKPPYCVMVQSFGNHDPRSYGFDAATQFPPHLAHDPKGFDTTTIWGLAARFRGTVVAYEEMVRKTLAGLPAPFPVFPCVSPGWDNTPRRGETATIYAGATPSKYAAWLRQACEHALETLPADRAFVFVNAWNEWAEGAHLEPNRRHGHAFLNATTRVLAQIGAAGHVLSGSQARLRILFVSHDAARAGAQILLLEHMRWLSRHASVDMRLLLLGDGPLREQFEALCPVLVCAANTLSEALVREFGGETDLVYGNTAVAAAAYDRLSCLAVPIVTHVHELEQSLRKFAGKAALEKMLRYTRAYVAASDPVRRNLLAGHGVPEHAVLTVNAFITPPSLPPASDKALGRRALGLPGEALLVLGCGSRDWRKGVDRFVEVARQLTSLPQSPPVQFVWVGGGKDPSIEDPKELVRRYGLGHCVRFVGECDHPLPYFLAADLFLLSSREDPFPLVCLEAAACRVPIVCFAGSGGMPDFVGDTAGVVIPSEDITAMAAQVAALLADAARRQALGRQAREKLLASHVTAMAVPHILAYCRELAQKPHPVSVIVPNYNYARYLDRRLASIYGQTYQDMEVIVLDDASTDESLRVLEAWDGRAALRLIASRRNSGNVFAQWRKGLTLAKGEFVWIAEADDDAEPHFLVSLLAALSQENTVLAYSLPQVIDGEGTLAQGFDYRASYLAYASETRWEKDYRVPGEQEVREALAVVNCVPNVSAAVFRRPDPALLDSCIEYRCSGDWMFYLLLAGQGDIAYVHGHLASHRRHESSVVGKEHGNRQDCLRQEMEKIHQYAQDRLGPLPQETLDRMRRFLASLRTDAPEPS